MLNRPMGTQDPRRASSLQFPGLKKRPHLARALTHTRGQGADFGRGLVQVGDHDGHETAGRTGPHASRTRPNPPALAPVPALLPARRASYPRIMFQLDQHTLCSPTDCAYGQVDACIEHAFDGQSMGGVRISCLLKPIFVHKRPQFLSCAAIPVKTRDFIRIGCVRNFHARTASHLNWRPTRK